MINKKGAIEFSMTTIMVIIIGVAVLALGLTWVRGTFTQVGGITETALENAETIFGEVAFSGKISAPATINMKANDAKKFRVLIKNTGDSTDAFYKISAIGNTNDCVTVAGETGTPLTSELATDVKILPDEVADIGGGILTKGDSVGGNTAADDEPCSVAANKQEIIRIEVEQKIGTGGTYVDYTSDAIAVQVS